MPRTGSGSEAAEPARRWRPIARPPRRGLPWLSDPAVPSRPAPTRPPSPGPATRPPALMARPSGSYWTTRRDGEVRLRRGRVSSDQQAPLTVHDMVMHSATRYGNYIALGTKRRNQWHLLTYIQYYELCRRAAKGFLKVRPGRPAHAPFRGRVCACAPSRPFSRSSPAPAQVSWFLHASTFVCVFVLVRLRIPPASLPALLLLRLRSITFLVCWLSDLLFTIPETRCSAFQEIVFVGSNPSPAMSHGFLYELCGLSAAQFHYV